MYYFVSFIKQQVFFRDVCYYIIISGMELNKLTVIKVSQSDRIANRSKVTNMQCKKYIIIKTELLVII